METTSSMTNRQVPRDRLLADLSLLFIAAVWGATFFMVKDATAQFPVLYFLALRFGLASLALIPLAVRLKRRPTGAELRWGILGGVLFCCGYIFQTFALGQIDSGRVGFITGLYVILVPMLALIFLRHRLKLRAIVGASLAVIGLALLSNAPGGNLAGDGLAFLCALSFAAQIIVVERFPRDADWRMISLIQAVCVGGISGVIAIFAEPLPATIPINVLGIAAFTGLLATALGLAIQVWAQRRLPPSDAAILFAMESPFSALFGFLFLAERLTAGGLFGCGLIMAGMLTTALTGEDPSEFH